MGERRGERDSLLMGEWELEWEERGRRWRRCLRRLRRQELLRRPCPDLGRENIVITII